MPQMSEWIIILWYLHTIQQYRTMNTVTWRYLKLITVSERSQTPPQKITTYDSIYIKLIYIDRKLINGCLGGKGSGKKGIQRATHKEALGGNG